MAIRSCLDLQMRKFWMRLLCAACYILAPLYLPGVCGNEPTIYHAARQADFFMSPGFPFGYPNNLDCEWILKAPKGEQVEVIFVEVLTEPCCDIVEVYDGNSSNAGLLATFRGNVTESIYMSSFGSLYIRFKSDDSFVDYGFLAEYRIATTYSNNCTRELKATETEAVLHSPGWSFGYVNNLYCTWTIRSHADQNIIVTFTEIDTESCCDYVLIRYGESMNSKLHELGGSMGSTTQANYCSPDNILQVVFRSDSSIASRGFAAAFKAVDRVKEKPNSCIPEPEEECVWKFAIPKVGHEVITTPGYPTKHANNLKCVWVLVAPKGHRLMMWFTTVNTEACCDFIKIRDGESPTAAKLGVLSGHRYEFVPYVSSSNIMRVEFESDISTANRGFRAVVEVLKDSSKERCGGERRAIVNKRRYFSSPNWPSSSSDPRCIWDIYAPTGYSVRLQVIGFRTSRYLDKLHFFDGAATKPFATMGGKTRPDARFVSSNNKMKVVFKSDTVMRDGGFRAVYIAVPKREATPRMEVPAIRVATRRED